MTDSMSRRETLKCGLAAAGILALATELASDEVDAPFTDYRRNSKVNGDPPAVNRGLDIRNIDGYTAPNDQFFFIQHYNRPEVDANSWRLKFTGLVTRPTELS